MPGLFEYLASPQPLADAPYSGGGPRSPSLRGLLETATSSTWDAATPGQQAVARALLDRQGQSSPGLLGLATPEVRAYQPTLRDMLANALMGPAAFIPNWPNVVEHLTGSRGIGPTGSPSLLDLTPFPVTEAQGAAERGDWLGATLDASAAIPGAGLLRGAAQPATKTVVRFSRSALSPQNSRDAPYLLFADNIDKVRGPYGPHGWQVNLADVPPERLVDATSVEFKSALGRALAEDWDTLAAKGYVNPDFNLSELRRLVNEAAPSDIVDGAGLWDNHIDLVPLVWEKVLEPRGWHAVQTPDGAVVFDPSYVRPLSR